MHAKYTTLGLILDRKPQGESNIRFSIFTQDFGLVEASAQAVREVKSKLRMSLGDLSFSEISLVRGKELWKITGAKKLFSLYDTFKEDKQKIVVSANIFGLLRRLLHGEEKNESLFSLIFDAFSYFTKEQLSEEETKNFERLLVLNILHELGYVGNKDEFKGFLNKVSWEKGKLKEIGKMKEKTLLEINRSLRESQL